MVWECRQSTYALPIFVQLPRFRHCSIVSSLIAGLRVWAKEWEVMGRGRIVICLEVEELVIEGYEVVERMQNEGKAMQVGTA